MLQPSLCGSASSVAIVLAVTPCLESLSETLQTLAFGMRLKTVELGTQFRKNLKNGNLYSEEVERTFTLLEKERAEKNELIRRVEKLERDIEGYIWAVKDRDSKINNLTARLKQRDKEAGDEVDKLKRENAHIKLMYEENAKKLKCASSKSKSESKLKNTTPKIKEQAKRIISPVLKTRRITSTPPDNGQMSRIPQPRFYKSICNIQPINIPKPMGIKNFTVGT